MIRLAKAVTSFVFDIILILIALILFVFLVLDYIHLNDVLTGVIALGTLSLAYVSRKTVKEMKQQRELSYQPALVMSNAFLFGYNKRMYNTNSILPVIWMKEELSEIEVTKQSGLPLIYDMNRFAFLLHNVGLGTARDIHVSWSLDLNTLVHLLEEASSKQHPIDVSYIENIYNIKLRDNAIHSVILIEKELERTYEFLQPSKDGESILPLTFPYSYLLIFSILIKVQSTLMDTHGFKLVKAAPCISLNISYKDIGGCERQIKYLVKLELHRLSSDSFSEYKKCFNGVFWVNKGEI